MSSTVTPARRSAKSARFPKGKQNFPNGNRISPVMQKLRDTLQAVKAAEELQFQTGQPLSICQKLLSGHRAPNGRMYEALFQSPLIVDVILGLTEGATDKHVRAVRKAVRRIKLEAEIARLDAGDDE
jgi:hypothetical protein